MPTAGQNKMSAEGSACCLLISGELARTGEFFRDQLICCDDRLNHFIDYLKDRHGKMLRASFVLLTGKLFGDVTPLHIKLAAIAEMIHSATLLHDDVIDHGTQRRYHATANNLWGPDSAVLMGDFLLARAFVAIASLQRDDIARLIAETTAKICQGEMLHNTCRGDFNISMEEYLEIIESKTAVFFADCCRLGAIASQADEQSVERLYEFGLNFGLAFQINDDLIDILGAENQTGKTAGRDFFTRTPTLPAIHALRTLSSSDRDELVEVFNSNQADIDHLISILHSSKSIEFAKSAAQQYQQKALAALEHFNSHPAAAELRNLVFSAAKTAV
ncbi:MAG: polyprenyl synthetase family protein [Sedimentisphaerales bacterium]|nr:polyprenyl synthetase family protein [Sedimentisphaerales bacterium]